ncbi:MAG: hypothetical protein QOH81_1077 [Sphingomonadales bacterium]|jgi:hypothetical protein|nr:hypothetical protein [Sphingomonadales bacterium]
MGAGVAASPHCPSYRRRRVAWRLPLGGSGRGRSEPRAVPRWVPSALARGRFPRGLAPDLSAWPRSLPASGRRGGRAGSGGSSRGPKPPGRFRSAETSGKPFRLRLRPGSRRTLILGLSASDRSELRSSAASVETGEPASPPASASPSEQAPPVRPGRFRSKRTSILRARRQRASPLAPAGPSAGRTPLPARSSHGPKQAPASGSSAIASAGRFPLRLRRLQQFPPRLPVLPGGFPKSGLASACAYAGPASSTVLPPAFRSILLRGKSFPPSAASGRDWVRFRAGIPSVHAMKAVMESESRQADSACG